MPILTQKNEVVIALTHQCNWNCEYCAVKNSIDQGSGMTVNDNLKRLSRIEDGQVVTFAGGEPGMLSRDDAELYISIARKKDIYLVLETNGLFLKRYPDLAQEFDEVLYHCSQDLQLSDSILCVEHPKMHYLLIVNDNNVSRLQAFLVKNSHLKFDVIEATYPYEAEGRIILSKKNKNFILCNLSNYMTRDSVERMIRGKDFELIRWYM